MEHKELNDLFSKLIPIVNSDNISDEHFRDFIELINDFFFTTSSELGKNQFSGEDYFSEWHKVWEKSTKLLLNPHIDDEKVNRLADVFNSLNIKYPKLFTEMYDTHELTPDQICNIRYFTANQDFGDSIDFAKMYKLQLSNPTLFTKTFISNQPEQFLKFIGVTKLSQGDKRVEFAKKAADILIRMDIEAIELFRYFQSDCLQIKTFLISNNIGYFFKKADMFIRDMVVLNVWQNPINFETINVAADVNTMKVALRTGLIKTDMKLITSFLDIYSYQYEMIVENSVTAWRKVWEKWKEKYPETCVISPCLMDYLIYRIIGREFCKEKLVDYRGSLCGHEFVGKSGLSTCKIAGCNCDKKINKLVVTNRRLPCEDDKGKLVFKTLQFVKGDDAILKDLDTCPLAAICQPHLETFIKYETPKSISIWGQTGWLNSSSTKGRGGGGMMG